MRVCAFVASPSVCCWNKGSHVHCCCCLLFCMYLNKKKVFYFRFCGLLCSLGLWSIYQKKEKGTQNCPHPISISTLQPHGKVSPQCCYLTLCVHTKPKEETDKSPWRLQTHSGLFISSRQELFVCGKSFFDYLLNLKCMFMKYTCGRQECRH